MWLRSLLLKARFRGTQAGQTENQLTRSKPIFLTSNLPTLCLDQSPDSMASATTALQELLNQNGYPCPITGKFDKCTEEALKDFQKGREIPADGVAGVISWTALRYPNLYFGVQHESTRAKQSVIELQERLREEGFRTTGDRLGDYGKNTEAAVRQFQRTFGLEQDGAADAMTMALLLGLVQRGKGKPPIQSAIYISRSEIVSHAQELTRLLAVVIGMHFQTEQASTNANFPGLSSWVTAFGIAWLVPWLTKRLMPRQRIQTKSFLVSYGPYVLLGKFSGQVLSHAGQLLAPLNLSN
jgi:peptidoglycan hydrolase-like protein with peptidoglycan-binding domain